MAVAPEYQPIAQEINQLSGLPGTDFKWWGKMLSSIVLSLGPTEVSQLRYITALFSGDEYEIAVFTDELVVMGETGTTGEDDAEFKVNVYSLKEVSTVSVNAEESAFGSMNFSNWPGRIKVVIEHPVIGSLSLPYSTEYSRYSESALPAFLPRLIELVGNRS